MRLKLFHLVSAILAGSIILIMAARFSLAVTRYLDPDEFAHLHWAYLMAQGNLPYQDFFLYHIPLFQWLLLPLFLAPPGWASVIVSRLLIWILSGANAFLLWFITKKISGDAQTALLSALILLVFPMTFDKSIEVRPDQVMIFFFLVAVALVFWAKAKMTHRLFLIGASFALATLTFPKILFAAPALVYLTLTQVKRHPKSWLLDLATLASGFWVPMAAAFLYFAASGILPPAEEAIFKATVAVNVGKQAFSPWLALSPYPLVYVARGGVSWPWIVNTAMWILAVLGLGILWQNHRRLAVFFCLFLAGAFGFLYLFPAPYLQYFLPLSVAASLLVALSFKWILRLPSSTPRVSPPAHLISYALQLIIILALLASFWQQYQLRIGPGADNAEQRQVIFDILRITRPQETVYDMVGSYIFRPDGYYICCHPYSEFINYLAPQPSLTDSLISRQTKFIVLDRTGQAFWLPVPADLQFIYTHYLSSSYRKIYTLGVQFSCTHGICRQTDLNNQPVASSPPNQFLIIVPETYTFSITPENQSINLNGQQITNGRQDFLTSGTYRFIPSIQTAQLRIQLAR